MTEPITTELRAAMNVDREYTMGGDVVARMYCMGRDEFASRCDAIDAIHANLERENESLRRELDRVLGEHEEAPTSIGSATITITPALDWSGIAADLRELAALCERTREEDE